MDELRTLATKLVDWAVAIGENINSSDIKPTTAFILGILCMFFIDRLLGRMFNYLKWFIVVGIVAGLGYSIVDIFGLFSQLQE